jgi:mRNA degradation ribonuclease J1/J2
MQTHIIALGTGSAFTLKNYQTNFIIERNGKRLLVDCGGDIRFSLRDCNLSFKDIDSVYISHAHADHIGGIEFLAFSRFFTKKAMEQNGIENPLPLPKLFCERGLIRSLWDHSLRGGMEGLEGIDATIDTYFDVYPIPKNGFFEWEGLKFDLVQSLHVSAKYSIVDSFGLMFTDNNTRIFITTDVQFAPETAMKAYYEEAHFIIHDCETAFPSGVHAHYNNLRTLPDKIKHNMLLVHYQDNVIDNWEEWDIKANKDGFIGFASKGEIYPFYVT